MNSGRRLKKNEELVPTLPINLKPKDIIMLRRGSGPKYRFLDVKVYKTKVYKGYVDIYTDLYTLSCFTNQKVDVLKERT